MSDFNKGRIDKPAQTCTVWKTDKLNFMCKLNG